MEENFELTEIRKDKAMLLSAVNGPTRQHVIRLLGREVYEMDYSKPGREGPSRCYLDPQSTPVLVWNFIFMLVFYLVELQISLSLAFGPTFFEKELLWTSLYLPVYLFFLLFLVADMLLCFFKGYYAFGKGKVVDDPRKIVGHYLRGQFPFDLVVVGLYAVPLFSESFGLNFLQLITAGVLWVKKFKYQEEIEVFLEYRLGRRASFMLTVLFLDVLMIGNYGACIFIGMDLLLYRVSYYGTGENSAYYWLTSNTSYPLSLITGPWYYQYIYGQQFATGTLSTMAPGPFGKNPIQIFYSILVMIFFVVVASYVAEVLIQITYTSTQRRTFHEDNIITFDNFMQLKEVGRSIRRRIHNFFELIWEVELKLETKEQEEMIDKLPLYLKEELLLQIGFTKHLHFLQLLPHQQALQNMVSLKIHRATVDADTCIFRTLHLSTATPRNIFFIKQGTAKFYLSREQLARRGNQKQPTDTVLSLTNLERVLGVYEFVTGQDYSICCRSIDLCLVQSLSWPDFKEIVEQLHMEEELHELRARVLVERELSLIAKCCIICQQPHLETQCPQLYPKERIVSGVKFKNRWGENLRVKMKRRQVEQKKLTSGEQLFGPSLFNTIPGLDLGQLLIDIYKMEGQSLVGFEAVADYDSYFKDYNVIDY